MRGPGPSVAGSGPTSAAYRLGAGAARALARASLPGALVLGTLWLAQNCFERQGASWVRTCGPGLDYPQSNGYEYNVTGTSTWMYDPTTAGKASAPWFKTNGPMWADVEVTTCARGSNGTAICAGRFKQNINHPWTDSTVLFEIAERSQGACPVGWYITPAGCLQNKPVQTVTEQEIEDDMATKPLPQTLPPGVPYPLDPTAPTIWNPTITEPVVPQPMRVPQGNPVPIPNTDPAQWRQPMTRVEHSPTADQPWRMDTRPEDVISESPTGQTGPETITGGSPPGTPSEEKTPDLCEKNPDIVACQKLGQLDAQPVANENKQLTIQKDSGWLENGSCPPARTANVLGLTLTFPWTTFCDFASMIRPLLIGFAWLSAALAFMGLGRKD